MKEYDILILGPAALDENIDYTGAEDRSVGGAVTYSVPAARAAGAKVFAAVKASENDAFVLDSIVAPAEDKAILPSSATTLMRNEYFTADRERRNSSCAAQSDPIYPEELPEDIDFTICHLAGLLYGDFPPQLLEHLRGKCLIAADVQGFLRCRENGALVFHDWPDKLRYLPYIDFLKTDALEAEILTGFTDRKQAARQLYEWGAKEILISHNSEMLVYDGKEYYTCPVKARNLSGRTGRGDTTTGAYLGKRITGSSPKEALLYATACVSLKMETPGVFRGSAADVESYIEQFYGKPDDARSSMPEKSCGAVVYKTEGGKRLYLIEHTRTGHTSIPKGHVEQDEVEEITALREIKEETALDVYLDTTFRFPVHYRTRKGKIKTVVFFTAKPRSNELVPQETEIESLEWLPYEEALAALDIPAHRRALQMAEQHLAGK